MQRNDHVFRKIIASFIILAMLLSFSGCMPYRELKDELIVEGMGIDYENNRYNITFQVKNMQKSNGGEEESKKSSGSNEVKLIQCYGDSLFDSVRNATMQNGRKLYFSNIRAFVVGEDVCRTRFLEIMDFMQRNQQIKPTERLFVAKGKAYDILSYEEDGNIVPAENMQQIAKSGSETSKVYDVRLLDIFKAESSGLIDPAIPLVSVSMIKGKPKLQISGAAYIRNDKLAGFLDADQTKGLMFVTGKLKGGVIITKSPHGATVTSEIFSSSTNVSISGDEKTPEISVKVKSQTGITEISSEKKYVVDDKFIKALEKQQEAVIKTEIESSIEQALNKNGSDVFGFRRKIYETKPELWRKLSKKWDEVTKKVKFTISVKTEVVNSGLTNKNI